MKRLYLFVSGILSLAGLSAQECMDFFPKKEGAVLINKTYDATNNLLGTMTYRVNRVYDYSTGTNLQIGFSMTDKNNNVIDNGNLDARCDEGKFFLNMTNRGMTSEIMNALTTDTELVSDFLDYPNIFNDDEYDFSSPFTMTGGEFTIQSKSDKKQWVSVRVYNRQYVANEKITTPAKSTPFHAAKVTFDFEVTKDNKTTRYTGAEWYALNAGIVRAETYDSNKNLINYTVLSTLQDNK